MGAAVGRAVLAEVVWASDGRSEATRQRAAGFKDVGSVDELVRSSEIVLSICPPAIAEDVARQVFDLGFDGVYVEANAISPERMRRIATMGPRVVDGSIIAASGINLYLAGDGAERVAELFANDEVRAIALDAPVGAASALKMAFGGWNKIGIALTSQAQAIARAYGVTEQLEAEGVPADRLQRRGRPGLALGARDGGDRRHVPRARAVGGDPARRRLVLSGPKREKRLAGGPRPRPLFGRRDGSGANGSSLTRPPSSCHLPATWPSTRNVLTELGVLMLKTSGRYSSGRICVRRAWTSSVASQTGRNRGGAGVSPPGSGARGRSTSSLPFSSRNRRRVMRSRACAILLTGSMAQSAISVRSAGPKPPR